MKHLFISAALVLSLAACNSGESENKESSLDQQWESALNEKTQGDVVDSAVAVVDSAMAEPAGPTEEELEAQRAQEKEDAYNALASKLRSMSGGYFAHDISGDGIPELFVIDGDMSAIKDVRIYTWYNGNLKEIYNETQYESSYYRGRNCVLSMSAHMESYGISKLTCRNGKLRDTMIDGGEIDSEAGEDYPHPSEPEFDLTPTSSPSALKSAFNR
ncbi:MAG: hypothetical protein MJZ74_06635 [Muribaculaceae bacterium]|nr:hypothetical protein [Muribaculaceae bacterium]